MRTPPEPSVEAALPALLARWGIRVAALSYAPVGFGDQHWTADDAAGGRWFVTVADLTDKPYCGTGVADTAHGLSRALHTALTLARGGLSGVVAPEPADDGAPLQRLGDRWAVSVYRHVAGVPGHFGEPLGATDRAALIDLLAQVHASAPPACVPAPPPRLPTRAALTSAVRALERPWQTGPYGEQARALLAEHTGTLARRLAGFDDTARRLDRLPTAVTHGEPHPGNLIRQPDRLRLIDWDTVALGVPERDLWLAAVDDADLDRYAEATGHRPDPTLLRWYRLRWGLDDVGACLAALRAPHEATDDAALHLSALRDTLAELATRP